MKIALQPTELWSEVRGVRCRVWQGATGSGAKVIAYIAAVAVPVSAGAGELSELCLLNPPPDEAVTPAWQISPAAVPALPTREGGDR